MTPVGSARATLPKSTLAETAAVLGDVVLPNLMKGPIIRRPRAVAMAERLDLDRRAVRRLQKLRDRYHTGPLMLRLPVRDQAVILSPEHVRRVLDHSPEPFATASSEKRAALAHFEPKGVLISHGRERAERRRYNEEVLQSDSPMHAMAERFLAVAREEGERLVEQARLRDGLLDWDTFIDGWFAVVRRVVMGDGARDDRELRQLINRLRSDANWAFLKPRRHRVRERFFDRLNAHLARAEPGSLAHMMASVPHEDVTAPDHQVPQWLFAFDPAGMAAFRALALLAVHPAEADRARQESGERGDGLKSSDPARPFLRACVLESLRLWPTTPMVLRETTEPTTWENGVMPAGTGILIFAPFFHRDDARLPYADHFAPDVWLEPGSPDQGKPPGDWPVIPFSAGPGICPGRNLVLLLTSQMLATLLDGRDVRLTEPDRLDPAELPGTLNNYSLEFRLG